MSTNEGPKIGQMCWLEVPATDPARARNFYTTLLGWECKEQGMPSPIDGIKETYYFSCGFLNGCFTHMEPSMIKTLVDESNKHKMGVQTTFAVESIDDSLVVIEKNGGKVHVGKTAIGENMGFFARFIDSEGNLMGVFSMK